jgi:hypothetical protein
MPAALAASWLARDAFPQREPRYLCPLCPPRFRIQCIAPAVNAGPARERGDTTIRSLHVAVRIAQASSTSSRLDERLSMTRHRFYSLPAIFVWWATVCGMLPIAAHCSVSSTSYAQNAVATCLPTTHCLWLAQGRPQWCADCIPRCGRESTRCVQDCYRSHRGDSKGAQQCADMCNTTHRECIRQCNREC